MAQKAQNTGVIAVSAYAQSDREVSEYYDEVCTGRENRHFSGRIESVYEKALYLSWSHQ